MTKPGEFPPDVVAVIWLRDYGCCVDCGRQLAATRRGYPAFEGGWSVQHRLARGQGGMSKGARRKGARPFLTRAANAALMCGDGVSGCHGRAEVSERARAYDLGFAVRSGITPPAGVPMLHALHGWVLLDDEGGWSPVGAPEGLGAAA